MSRVGLVSHQPGAAHQTTDRSDQEIHMSSSPLTLENPTAEVAYPNVSCTEFTVALRADGSHEPRATLTPDEADALALTLVRSAADARARNAKNNA